MILACLFALCSACNSVRTLTGQDKEKQDLCPQPVSIKMCVRQESTGGVKKKIIVFSLGLEHMDYKEDCCACLNHNINSQVTE